MNFKPTPRLCTPVCLAIVLVTLAGCQSMQYGSELSATPKPLVLDSVADKTLRLPQDKPFAIHTRDKTEKPLLNGKADAGGDVDEQGKASATASVREGGVAESVFRLGHTFQNGTNAQAALTIKVRYQFAFDVKALTATAASDATAGLRLYVRDGRGRLLRTVPLLDHSSADGDVQKRGRDEVEITASLPAGDSLSVFVAGQSHVDVPDERSASASLTLEALEFEIVARPVSAPPADQAKP